MNIKKLTYTAIISAIAFLMLMFKIPVSFLSYEIKDVIILIGALYLGTYYGIIISFVVSIIEMITISSTGFIGFFMNFLATISYILPICYIYNKNKSIIKGIILGTICMSVVMFIFNIFMTPLFLKTPLKETVNLLFTLITPFNIIKGALNGLIIYFIHKPILKALKKSSFEYN